MPLRLPAVVILALAAAVVPSSLRAATPPSEYPPPVHEISDSGPRDHAWTWALGSVALVSAIAGGTLLGVAASEDSALVSSLADQVDAPSGVSAIVGVTQKRAYSDVERIQTLQLSGWVLVGVASASAIATLVVGLTRSPSEDDPDDPTEPYRAQWELRPYLDPARGDAGVALGARF